MSSWTITPNSIGDMPVTSSTTESGEFSVVFPRNNTEHDVIFTIKYIDDDGQCGTTTYTVPKCDSPGPGPDTCDDGCVNITASGDGIDNNGNLDCNKKESEITFTAILPINITASGDGIDNNGNLDCNKKESEITFTAIDSNNNS